MPEESAVKVLADKLVDVATQQANGLLASSNRRMLDLQQEAQRTKLTIERQEAEIERLRGRLDQADSAWASVARLYQAVNSLLDAKPGDKDTRARVRSEMQEVHKRIAEMIPF
jgi:predicted  nucleic acid-binding Zn-ribbon protein